MSQVHPIIAVTGSSGAGTTTVKRSFEHIFRRERITAAVVEGDSFHRYNREEMKLAIAQAAKREDRLQPTHFGPDTNLLPELASLFKSYGKNGTGKYRLYLHNEDEARPWNQKSGTFTPWTDLPTPTDMMFYEGLHGGFQSAEVDVQAHVDMLIGVVPVVNLEWIQKIHRDTQWRGYSIEAVTDTILRRMHDYVHYICPQFSLSHINFQRVPVVDTSNPFIAKDIPSPDESMVVIRFRDPHGVDFPYLLNMIHNSFMSRPNIIVVPGGKMELALQLVLTPFILNLHERSLKSRKRSPASRSALIPSRQRRQSAVPNPKESLKRKS